MFDELVKSLIFDAADLVPTGPVSQHQAVGSFQCLHRLFVPHMGKY